MSWRAVEPAAPVTTVGGWWCIDRQFLVSSYGAIVNIYSAPWTNRQRLANNTALSLAACSAAQRCACSFSSRPTNTTVSTNGGVRSGDADWSILLRHSFSTDCRELISPVASSVGRWFGRSSGQAQAAYIYLAGFDCATSGQLECGLVRHYRFTSITNFVQLVQMFSEDRRDNLLFEFTITKRRLLSRTFTRDNCSPNGGELKESFSSFLTTSFLWKNYLI
ncbi:hypothetical protein T4B_15207 [Trichinella pseudospiralis]|uniref:Uncharacterized protein n=1 Tax=Trichinella pseudospiralis TaxID=6337 RepID=A0A0V1J5N2_TRIPS|nr:hypothetical protein T4B_15207 [Trichinella pseudospiralis]